jgi:hypothetical protein
MKTREFSTIPCEFSGSLKIAFGVQEKRSTIHIIRIVKILKEPDVDIDFDSKRSRPTHISSTLEESVNSSASTIVHAANLVS